MGTDTGAEGKIKRYRCLEHALLRHMELLDQQRPPRIRQFSVDFRAHGGLPLALGEHGGSLFSQILLPRELGEEDVGIPGHLHYGRLEDILLLQQQRQETPHQLIREDDLLHAVDLEAEVWGNAVHRDDGKLLDRAPAEEGHHIALLSPEERQRLIRVDDLREEQVLDVAEKLFAHELIDLVDLVEVQDLDAVAFQLAADRFPDALHQAQLLSRDAQHFLDGFLGDHPRNRISLIRRQDGPVRQDADTHPVELLQVRLVDHQELQPFQQRHRCVRRFQQHPFIEAQPAELAVDIQALFLFRRLLGCGAFLFCRQIESPHSAHR